MKTICLDLTDADLAYLMADVDETFGLPRRMAARVAVDLDTGCWLAAGSNTGKGHAKVSVKGKDRMFHRVAFQCLVGPIPDKYVLDHKKDAGCRHRNCCNPAHLEPVTVQENTLRGEGINHWFQSRKAA